MKLFAFLAVTFVSLSAAATDLPGHFKGSCESLSVSQAYNKDGSKDGDLNLTTGHTDIDETVTLENGLVVRSMTGTLTAPGGPNGYTYTINSKTEVEKPSKNIERDIKTYDGDANTKAYTVTDEYKIEQDGSKTALSSTDEKGKVTKFKGYSNDYVTADGTSVSISIVRNRWIDSGKGMRVNMITSKMNCVSHLVKD
jgi:hypothetical protein